MRGGTYGVRATAVLSEQHGPRTRRGIVNRLRYDDPARRSHAEATEVLEAALAGAEPAEDPNAVLIGLALHDDDRSFVEEWCRRIGAWC